jgi:hypothetical protein
LFSLEYHQGLLGVVPNLAFSEMEFLQLSHHQIPVKMTSKGNPKSRGEGRKSEWAHKDITDFFQREKYPFHNINASAGCSKGTSHSISNHEECVSYISWSNSQHTSTSILGSHGLYNPRLDSPIPESVQQSIERTGIFDDTGIDPSARFKSVGNSHHFCSSRDPDHAALVELLHRDDSIPALQSSEIQSVISQLQPSAPHDDQTSETAVSSGILQHESHHHEQAKASAAKAQSSRDEDAPVRSPIVPHGDPSLQQLTLANRAQLGKIARIKLPLVRLSAGRLEHENPWGDRTNHETSPRTHGLQDKAAYPRRKAEELNKSSNVACHDVPREKLIFQAWEERLPSGQSLSRPEELCERPANSCGMPPSVSEHADNLRYGSKVLGSPQLEPRLETPASRTGSSRVRSPLIEYISNLSRPIKIPSLFHSRASSLIPTSSLMPNQQLDPLFLRQLHQQKRGGNCHQYHDQHSVDQKFELQESEIGHRVYTVDRSDSGDYAFTCQDELDHNNYQVYTEIQESNIQQFEIHESQKEWPSNLTSVKEELGNYNDIGHVDWSGRGDDEIARDSLVHDTLVEKYIDRGAGDDEYSVYDVEETEQLRGFWWPRPYY